MKLLISLLVSFNIFASLNVVTTTSNLAAVAKEIGGDKIDIISLAKGSQDPHFLEAKPSYTFKVARADLLISVGAELEIGWLPLIVRGSRNPKLREGNIGRLVVADNIELIKEHSGPISRAQGDVHPEGNPHLMLGPSNSIKVAKLILDRFSKLDAENTKFYQDRFESFSKRMNNLILELRKSIVEGKKIITYHRTLTYFLAEFGVNTLEVLEPKPGIPPTASHIINVINIVKTNKLDRIIVENYFDTSVAHRVKKSVPSIKIFSVPVAVNGDKESGDIFKLYRQIAKALVK